MSLLEPLLKNTPVLGSHIPVCSSFQSPALTLQAFNGILGVGISSMRALQPARAVAAWDGDTVWGLEERFLFGYLVLPRQMYKE